MLGATTPRRWRVIIDLMAVVSLCALLIASWALAAHFQSAKADDAKSARIWHAVICDIERKYGSAASGDSKEISRRKREFRAYYDSLLVHDAHAAPCGLNITGR